MIPIKRICFQTIQQGARFSWGQRRFFPWLLTSLLIVGLSQVPFASAQIPNLGNDSGSKPQPNIEYIQRGNIHIADVKLDGVAVVQVATPASSDDPDNPNHILPIEWRVNEIETRLAKIVDGGFDPTQLDIQVNTVNNQSVVFAESGEDWTLPLMTVTDLDREIDSTSNDLEAIAQGRAEKIKTALLFANQERQPNYIKQQLFYLLIIVLGVVFTNLILWQLQRYLRKRWRIINQDQARDNAELLEKEAAETTKNTASEWMSIAQSASSPLFSLSKQRSLNLLLRSLIWWSQVTIFLGGLILGLLLFPQTRGSGIWLIGVPVSFIAILLGLSLAKKFIDFLIIYWLRRWSEHDTLSTTSKQRVALRIPTIAYVLQEVTLYIVIGLGILMFLSAIRAPLTLVLTGLGVVGFSSQSLIKDWIAGFLILWEDQYTQGDVVKIHDRSGIVEYLNLRITQLRTLEGKLVTIANGSFSTAVNFTYQWSQIDLTIDVAYSTDLDQAMAVILRVVNQMEQDPTWQPFIRESTILGVDTFGESSIGIRLLIKTMPMKQWDVGREYRRRLKSSFDQAGISIPFPQRSIWIEGAANGQSAPDLKNSVEQ